MKFQWIFQNNDEEVPLNKSAATRYFKIAADKGSDSAIINYIIKKIMINIKKKLSFN